MGLFTIPFINGISIFENDSGYWEEAWQKQEKRP
jgi:hypothetical protein